MPTHMRTDTPRAVLRSTIGMKAVMATSGAILVAYVVSHVAANLLVFHSPEAINGYGALLHSTGPLLWVARGVLLLAAVLHVTAAVRLTRQARRARPVAYAAYEAQAATLAARTIRWGGVALLLFLLVHVPQMTTGFLHPQFRAGDDYGNVVHVFRVWWVTPLYLAALAALGLHLYHGTWSALRTLGVSGRRAFPLRRPAVATLAALVALGFASIPLAVALGVLSAPPPAVAAAYEYDPPRRPPSAPHPVTDPVSRRDLLRTAAALGAALALPAPLRACARPPRGEGRADAPAGAAPVSDPDRDRLAAWVAALRARGAARSEEPLGRDAARVGELAVGTPYEAFTLEAYLKAGGSPSRTEPLTLSLTRFDCVSLVEACLAVARVARGEGEPSWARFAREMERMRYGGGERGAYATRLHYFSEWIADGERRELVRDLGAELGGGEDARPLRFMSEHRGSYPALADDGVLREIAAMERSLDGRPRRVIPTARIPEVSERIETGDVLAFATSIPGLDVTHAAFAYRDAGGVLRVLHAPLSGGAVEVTRATLPEYVAAIRSATGILVARPLPA